MHLLVCCLNKLQNARCDDKDNSVVILGMFNLKFIATRFEDVPLDVQL